MISDKNRFASAIGSPATGVAGGCICFTNVRRGSCKDERRLLTLCQYEKANSTLAISYLGSGGTCDAPTPVSGWGSVGVP